jgi:RimK family alpha-L-glutamate ligase
MTRLVTLVSGLGWHVQDLLRASKLVGVALEPVPFPSLTGTIGAGADRVEAGDALDLTRVDGVLVRMMPPGTLEQVVFRMDALHRLEAAGVPLMNAPRAVEVAVDKYLATARLSAAGLPVPATWAGETAEAAMTAFESFGGDVVLKPLFGSEGRGLVRLEDAEVARRVFAAIERIGSVLYVQKYVRHPGYDIRAFVLAGRVLGAMRRHAPAGDWRTNVAVGGRPERAVLTESQRDLAVRAAAAVGATMAGVDLLHDPEIEGDVVLEVNAVPGWKALAAATGVDVAAALLEHLKCEAPR